MWARKLLLGAMVIGLVAGCATPQPEKKAESPVKKMFYWPALPEQPRYVYEATLRGSGDLRPRNKDDIKNIITGQEEENVWLKKPFDVAVRQGRVYVTDTDKRIVWVFDLPRRRFFALGYRLEGQLNKPLGISVDDAAQVYVVDGGNRHVVVYDGLGLFVRHIGTPDDFVRPTGIAVTRNGDRIYVVDTGGVESTQHRVTAFDRDGKKLFTFGTRGDADGEFNLPVDVAVARDGTVYVLDAGNFRVQVFSPDGKFLRKFGSLGASVGQLARPRGLAVDDNGNVYVTDANFSNVQVFDGKGDLLLPIGEKSDEDGPGRYALPAGIATDETGRVFLVDQFFRKVEVLRYLSETEGKRILGKQ